jgi:hypothetical protein
LLFIGVSEGRTVCGGVIEAARKGVGVRLGKLATVGVPVAGSGEPTGTVASVVGVADLVKPPTIYSPKTKTTNKIPPIAKKISRKIRSAEGPRGVVRGGLGAGFITFLLYNLLRSPQPQIFDFHISDIYDIYL